MRYFDYSSFLNRKWDKETVNYVALIRECKGREEFFLAQKPQELERLVDVAIRQSTEASNAIEGIRTTNERLKKIVEEKTTPRNRDEKEILGYRRALAMVHESYEYIPIRPNCILQLHNELCRYADVSYGGKFKNSPNEIDAILPDGTKKMIFEPLRPYETPMAVESLCEEYEKAIGQYGIDPLLVIPVFIHDFLCIHPFSDGNGRMSRLLTTLLLYKSGFALGKYISLEKKIADTKEDYYDALSESSEGWREGHNDDTPFIKYILGTILAAYRDFEERVEIVSAKLPAKEAVREAIKKKLGKFTKSDIMELCANLSSSSIEAALKSLCEEGFIAKQGGGRSSFYIRKY